MRPPEYFKRVRDDASSICNMLEDNPKLAGPWRQLFAQVQSPRHVVSELLQNADDAGATDVSIKIHDGEFVFSHNGEDFSEEQFASLCRFGSSNKQMLHTIGFRGMGFKSTFSLGDEVRLVTPTLSVAFRKQRFIEPVWIDSPGTPDGRTEVRVAIQKQQVRQLAKNLERWGENPASLLFFNNIRCLRINGQEIRWESRGDGPVRESEYMSFTSNMSDNQYLIIRSSEEEFPEDALREIMEERMIPDGDADLPPCRVEVVLGMEGQLFTVLPTNVMTGLPFACNAPFVQDPARYGIKDPTSSPTNDWLLKRVGQLAAGAMLAWVGRESLPAKERCRAYELLPDMSRDDDGTIGADCNTIIREIFEGKIEGAEFLLTEAGTLESNKCLGVPGELLDVWSPSQVFAGFSANDLPILSRYVSKCDREKLDNLGRVSILDKSQVIETLQDKSLPRPESWRQLLRLWNYVSDEITATFRSDPFSIRIVPVQEGEALCAADEVVRLGEKRILKNPADYEFLAPYLLTFDREWTHFLSQQSQTAEVNGDQTLEDQVSLANRCVSELGLDKAADVNHIMKIAADNFFSCGTPRAIQDCVRLAHIAARLKAAVPDSFEFMTQNMELTSGSVLADIDNDLDMFVDANWYSKNALHGDYCAVPSETCTADEWRRWARSPDSRLHTFVPLDKTTKFVYNRGGLVKDLSRRGFDGKPYFHYRRDSFKITDYDFDQAHWEYWAKLAEDNDKFWAELMVRILGQPSTYWSEATSARASQVGYNSHFVTQEPLLPEWIIRFRGLCCLPDTLGRPRQPAEILMQTPETAPLLGIEHFVRADLDTEKTKPLLELLGVRDKPTSPKPILDRLRALATTKSTPLLQVQKWYNSLDQMYDRCSTEEIQEIKTVFANDKLILTDQNGWTSTDGVFLNSSMADAHNTPLIHHSLCDMSLWRKIGVKEFPTADEEIEWAKGLPSNGKLDNAQIIRIQHAMRAYPHRVWYETDHWLNLEGGWAPVNSLIYSVTFMQQELHHLFPGVKVKIADFRSLSPETRQKNPFSDFPELAESIEIRVQKQRYLPDPQERPWLGALGAGLQRIVLDDPDKMEHIRARARKLSTTRWQVAEGLKYEPYIDGAPAGFPRIIGVLWHDDLLYVQKGSVAKLAKLVPQKIAIAFDLPAVTEAVKLCYERSPDFVMEYLEDNFKLAPHIDEDEPGRPDAREIQPDTIEGQSGAVSPSRDGQLLEVVQPEETASQNNDANGGYKPSMPSKSRTTRFVHPSLIERFARVQGFIASGTGKFKHEDGRSLERTPGNAFPWGLRSAQGTIVQYYLPKEHCIQKEPLQLDVTIWELCMQHPTSYSLVLTDADGAPDLWPGSKLAKMREQGRLVLYSAAYRLEYRGEE